MPYTSGTPRALDVAEFIEWPSRLDATQRGAVHAAMKAHYSFLA